jgi:pimeloyl-ACP methyl ester carboxylesterase
VDVSQIIFQLFYSTGAIPILPALISTTAEGNYAILSNLLSLLLLNQDGPQSGGLNIGMTVAVQCNEDVTYASAADFVRARDRNRLASPLAFGILNNEAFLEVCQSWGLGAPLPGRNLPVRSDRPSLLIGGQFDPITPEQNLSLAGDSLTNDFSIVVPRGGHTPSAGSPCLQSVVAAFVNNPQQQPDAACLGREVLPFLVP